MNAYTLMMALVLYLAILMRGNIQGNKKYIWLSCFFMFALCAFRDVYEIGIDSASSYIRIFREHGAMSWEDMPSVLAGDHNVGFSFFLKWIYELTGGNYQAFIVIYSVIVFVVFARFIEKYSCCPVQSFAYYWGLIIYIMFFDILKQGFAMTFVLLAFDSIMERKPLRFILLVLTASLFHVPALVFLPAYWIAKMKVGKGYVFVLIGMFAATYLLREQILELMTDIYETTIYETNMRFFANKVLIMLVIIVAALILRPPSEEDRMYNILLQFMGIAAVIQTFAGYNNTFERLANYYFQFSVIFIPLVFQRGKIQSLFLNSRTAESVKYIAPYLFGGFGVWRFANYIQNNDWLWLPFRFFFQR